MNKQISTTIGILIVLLFAGIAGVSVLLLSQEDEGIFVSKEKGIEKGEEPIKEMKVRYMPKEGTDSREIQVIEGESKKVFYSITIDELNEWLEKNQDAFEDIPEIVGILMTPKNFTFFGSASLCPRQSKLAFSVNKYAYLIDTSFILIVDLETEEISAIKSPVTGVVENFVWSRDCNILAYSLSTARGGGDYLSIDNTLTLERDFLLSGEDILQYLEEENLIKFLPSFRELEWKESYLSFTTNHPQEGHASWSIDVSNGELQLEEYFSNDIAIKDNQTDLITDLWEKLPQEITVGERTAVLDTESVEPTMRTEFSEFPYVIREDEIVKMEDYLPEMTPKENPLEYAKRLIEIRLNNMFGDNGEPLHLGQYMASFYHTTEGRVAVYVRGMNYLDDSVGGSEFRIDFQPQNNEWKIVWAGHRYYCRRMHAEYWSPPADKLCP